MQLSLSYRPPSFAAVPAWKKFDVLRNVMSSEYFGHFCGSVLHFQHGHGNCQTIKRIIHQKKKKSEMLSTISRTPNEDFVVQYIVFMKFTCACFLLYIHLLLGNEDITDDFTRDLEVSPFPGICSSSILKLVTWLTEVCSCTWSIWKSCDKFGASARAHHFLQDGKDVTWMKPQRR